MSIETDPPDRFVRLDEVKRRVGLGKSLIYRPIQEGRFPVLNKVALFVARWSDLEIIAWIIDVEDGFEGKKRKVWTMLLSVCPIQYEEGRALNADWEQLRRNS